MRLPGTPFHSLCKYALIYRLCLESKSLASLLSNLFRALSHCVKPLSVTYSLSLLALSVKDTYILRSGKPDIPGQLISPLIGSLPLISFP